MLTQIKGQAFADALHGSHHCTVDVLQEALGLNHSRLLPEALETQIRAKGRFQLKYVDSFETLPPGKVGTFNLETGEFMIHRNQLGHADTASLRDFANKMKGCSE